MRETRAFSYAGCVSAGRASCYTEVSVMFVSVYEREAGKRENVTPKSVHLCALVKYALASAYERERRRR